MITRLTTKNFISNFNKRSTMFLIRLPPQHPHHHHHHHHYHRRSLTTGPLLRSSQSGALLNETEVETSPKFIGGSKANTLFHQAWKNIEQYYGMENIRLPRELFFLMGAPGAGKGTHTPLILNARGIKNSPIGISQLVQSPECRQFMDQGLLLSDSYVIELMLHAIIQSPHPESGVLIDGFPRTEIQAEVLHLLYEKWTQLRSQFANTTVHHHFPRPSFRICVLYVDKETSVQRQLERGQKIRKHNQHVKSIGQGELLEERVTDFDERLIRARYDTFESNYGSLLQLADSFPFHLIDASGTEKQVIQAILKEFDDQSSFELESEIHNALTRLPDPKKIGLQQRQDLVGRLEYYYETQPATLQKAIQYIELHVLPHILQHSHPGQLSIPFIWMINDCFILKRFSRNNKMPTRVDLTIGHI
ncbi:adenylate kinase [Halteromyces radiatus]|uniref:adenylate kinase n=1 Tax=Halteromyces radiatus TaxID=101107 RepID=UPI002220B295|nr:adenylate kinase [Halteromyces radiatus]KAI8088833.1 adenylate kinase [Halteromyces radiatus]